MTTRRLIAAIATIAVIVGIGKTPYGYYNLLRLGICGFSLFLLFGTERVNVEWQRWVLGATAVLYNPFLPVVIGDKDIWIVLNIATAALFWLLALARPSRT